MWLTHKRFFNGYLLLCLLSLLCFGHPWIQRLLVLGWVMHIARTAHHARHNGIRLFTLLGIVCVSQLPGIILMLINSWSIACGAASEWTTGLLEAWYHPFISVLEMLPHGNLGHWSDMYLETCLIPVAIIVVTAACWMVMGNSQRSLD